MAGPINVLGGRFNRVRVLSRAGSDQGGALWNCVCDCGKEFVAYGHALASGKKQSCGCLAMENGSRMGSMNRRHGMTGTTEYNIWLSMRARCNNPKAISYEDYGARGIGVCDRWEQSFDAFYADMGPRPPETSLDRIDGTKGYSPENCRWATPKEQQRNRRNNAVVAINGRSQCVSAWLEEFGIAEQTYYSRVRLGWTTQEALTLPPDLSRRKRRNWSNQALTYEPADTIEAE